MESSWFRSIISVNPYTSEASCVGPTLWTRKIKPTWIKEPIRSARANKWRNWHLSLSVHWMHCLLYFLKTEKVKSIY